MNNRMSREELVGICFFAAVFLFIGMVAGYSARAVSSNDRFLVSTATKHFTDAELSQRQINQIIKEGSKGEPK